jgi:lipopolysaccharide assembly outer membrane protein LptD (OstA)
MALVLAVAARAPAVAQTLPPLPIEVTGATRLEYQDSNGIVVAEGAPVMVVRGRTVVRAPLIRYDSRARVIDASGGVEVAEPGLSLRGTTAVVRLSDEVVRVAGGAVVRSQRDGEESVLEAPQFDGSLATRRFTATGGVIVRRGEWTVRGQRIDYDDRSTTAVVSGDPEARYRDATMTANTITVVVAQEIARGEGSVRLRRGETVATAPRAEMNGRTRSALLSGGATVERGRDRLTAATIDIDLETERVTARGEPHLVINP